MREIVLDTETTGLDPKAGHRIVEIGAVELVNKVATGRRFHVYLNPERDMPDEAFRVHGLSREFLADKPVFTGVVQEFLSFIRDDPLVIHNAEFDIGFLHHELTGAGFPGLSLARAVDTLALARRKHGAASNSLDALCARYGIDASQRKLHGALLDAQLLAEVYLELSGGVQSSFDLALASDIVVAGATPRVLIRPAPLVSAISPIEQAAHAALIESIGERAIWRTYFAQASCAA